MYTTIKKLTFCLSIQKNPNMLVAIINTPKMINNIGGPIIEPVK